MNTSMISPLVRVAYPLAFAAWLVGCEDAPPALGPVQSDEAARAVATAVKPCPRSDLSLGVGSKVNSAAPAASLTSGDAGHISGGGSARVTDINGAEFPASFAISASVDPQGNAHGTANFVFGPDFSAIWAVAPGARSIHVRGKVTSMTAGAGTITLGGNAAIETEIFPGAQKIVFTNEPFEVTVSGPDQFTFWWCEVPVLQFDVLTGQLNY